MRPVVLFIASSLDGRIAGPHGEIDWLFSDADYGYKRFLASVDTVLMGRKTYEVCRRFSPYPYTDKRSVVFTRKRGAARDEFAEFVREPVAFVKRLKRRPGKAIWLCGGGEIVTLLLNAGLVDEIRQFVHPVLLGEGIPIYPEGFDRTWLKARGCRKFPSGLIELTYSLER